MSEREKMLAGEIYDCGDTQLLKQWHFAKDILNVYGRLASNDKTGIAMLN